MLGIQFQDELFYWWSTQNTWIVFILLLLILRIYMSVYLFRVHAHVRIHTFMQTQAGHRSCVKVKGQRATPRDPLPFVTLWDPRVRLRIRPSCKRQTSQPLQCWFEYIDRPEQNAMEVSLQKRTPGGFTPISAAMAQKIYWPSLLELLWLEYQLDSRGP